jgi:hypothetical protein
MVHCASHQAAAAWERSAPCSLSFLLGKRTSVTLLPFPLSIDTVSMLPKQEPLLWRQEDSGLVWRPDGGSRGTSALQGPIAQDSVSPPTNNSALKW